MKAIALSLVHVGINPETAEEMDAMRGFIRDVLGMEEGQETPISWFGAGNRIEFMKEKGRGGQGAPGLLHTGHGPGDPGAKGTGLFL